MTSDGILTQSEILTEVAQIASGDISGSSRQWEQQLLYALARASGATRLLEVGCHVGLATVWLAVAARENSGHLIAIDFSENATRTTRTRLESYGLDSVVEVITSEAAKAIGAMPLGEVFDFVFLDSDHRVQNFTPIFDSLWPRLVPGGLLCVHDIDFVEADERWWFPQMFPAGIQISAVHGSVHSLPLGLGITQKPRE